MKSILLSILLLLAIASAATTDVLSCSYPGDPDPPLHYLFSQTEKAFIGKVVKISTDERRIDGSRYAIQKVSFDVEKVFKGSLGAKSEIVYREPKRFSSCDEQMPIFELAKSYFVYDGDTNRYKYRGIHLSVFEIDTAKD